MHCGLCIVPSALLVLSPQVSNGSLSLVIGEKTLGGRERERKEQQKSPKGDLWLPIHSARDQRINTVMCDAARMSLARGLALVRFITWTVSEKGSFRKPRRGKANTISAFNEMPCYVRVQVPFSLSDKSSYRTNFILSSYFAFGG